MATDDVKTDFREQSNSVDREIITIGIGACGNRIGQGFWKNILDEHAMDQEGYLMDIDNSDAKIDQKDAYYDINIDNYTVDNTRIHTYFREVIKSDNGDHNLSNEGQQSPTTTSTNSIDNKIRYVPRNIIVDTDATTIDSVAAGTLGGLFHADQYIFSGNSANNLYSLGYNSLIIDDIIEEIRSESEKCSSFQGFQIFHSVGGGTGSGLTAHLTNVLRDDYFDRIISSYTVYPSDRMSDIVIEPYNTVLSMPSILSYHDINFVQDNETLYHISDSVFKNLKPDFKDLNEWIANIISSSTAGIRFRGSLNMCLRKLCVNLLPFPRLKFISVTDAPLMSNNARKYTRINIETLCNELFHQHQFLSSLNIDTGGENGKYISGSILFRGNPNGKYFELNEYEMDNSIRNIVTELKLSEEFLNTMPYQFHSSICYQQSQHYPLTATLFANNTSIKCLYETQLDKMKKLYNKKAFLHYYYDSGMTQNDFDDAIEDIADLLQEYNERDGNNVDVDQKDDNSDYVNNSFKPSLDFNNRKKLQKNDKWWKKLKKIKKVNKKVYVRPNRKKYKPKNKNKNKNKKSNKKRVTRNINANKRKVINRKILLKNKQKNNKNKVKKKKKFKPKKKSKKKQKKRKINMSSTDDDFEETSSSDDDDDGNDNSTKSSDTNSSSDTTSSSDDSSSDDDDNNKSSKSSDNSSSTSDDDDKSSDTDDDDKASSSSSSSSSSTSTDSENTDSDDNASSD